MQGTATGEAHDVIPTAESKNATDLKGVIAYASKTPGGITYSTTGRGSNSELLGEMMKAAFKIEMRDVPYRGAAPALMDVMKGEIACISTGSRR